MDVPAPQNNKLDYDRQEGPRLHLIIRAMRHRNYRLFFAGPTLRLAGAVDAASVTRLRQALAGLPAGTPAAVDLGPQAAVSAEVAAMLGQLAGEGRPVTVYGQAATLEEFRAAVSPVSESLVMREY